MITPELYACCVVYMAFVHVPVTFEHITSTKLQRVQISIEF